MFTPDEEIWLQFLGFMTAQSPQQVSLNCVENFAIEPNAIPSHYDASISNSLMLGKRAERFLSFHIQQHPNYEILAENVQIVHEKETIGELDFLLKHSEIGLIHLEMACKFYLYNPEATTIHKIWCGPNNRDFLSHKKQKLMEHQFPLLQDVRTQQVLHDLNISSDAYTQMLLFQNFCFLPAQYEGTQDGVDNTNNAGTWMNQDTFESLSFDRELFFFPKKTNWLVDPMYNREWHLLDAIKPKVQAELKNRNSPMLWVLHPDGRTERWFVVWW